MVAVLKQIEVQPVSRPRYINRQLNSFSAWYRDNEPALGEYWLALGGDEQARYADDFHEFVLVQHDIEQEQQAEARHMVYGEPNE